MQCVFLDFVLEQRPDCEKIKTKDCKAGETDFALEFTHVEFICETDDFLKCPRFQARVMINKGNIIKQTKPEYLSNTKLKLPCVFLSSKKVNSGTSESTEFDCQMEFEKFKPECKDQKKYCSNENFLNCPRFQARVIIHQDK